MSIERQAVSGLKWTGIAKLGSQLGSWVITLIVLRLLSPEDYGLMALVSVVISVLMTVAEMGLGSSIVQARQFDMRELARLNGLVVALNLAACLLLVTCAPLVAQAFHEPRLTDLVRVSSLQLLLSALATTAQSLAYRQMRFRRLAFVEVSSVLAGGLCTLALAWAGAGVWALVFGGLAQGAARAAQFLLDGWVRPVFAPKGMRQHLGFGGTLAVSRLLWQLVAQSDVLIAGRYLPSAAVGLYAVSAHLATLPMQKIMGVVNQVAFPTAARLQTDLSRLQQGLLSATRLLVFASTGALWGLSSVAPEFVTVVLGDRWTAAVFPLQMICLVVPLRMLGSIFATAALGLGHSRLDLRNSATSAAILPLAFYVGVQWGPSGLATAWLVAAPIAFLANFPRLARALGICIRRILESVRAPLVAGPVMFAAVAFVRVSTPALTDAARLALLIGVGAGVYLAVALSLDKRIAFDLRRFAAAL